MTFWSIQGSAYRMLRPYSGNIFLGNLLSAFIPVHFGVWCWSDGGDSDRSNISPRPSSPPTFYAM